MNSRIRITASNRFLKSGQNIVVAVAVPVVAHGAFLRNSGGVFKRDFFSTCVYQRLAGVNSLTHIAAAGGRNIVHNGVRRCYTAYKKALKTAFLTSSGQTVLNSNTVQRLRIAL